MKTPILKHVPLHPVLLGIYPVLALLGHNINEIRGTEAMRALLIALAGALLLYWAANLLLRNRHRAALAATLLIVFFFSYGHIYGFFKQPEIFGGLIGRHRILAPGLLLLTGAGIWWSVWRLKTPSGVTQPLNLASIVLLVFPLYQIASFQAATFLAGDTTTQNATRPGLQENSPDIYYIVLDAYARADDLEGYYQFDNSPFLNGLEDMGFYIGSCSQSNYAKTKFSMASSLNYDYLQNMGGEDLKKGNGEPDWVKVGRLIRHGEVRQFLEGRGYRVVAFQTGFFWTEWDDADIYLQRASDQFSGPLSRLQVFGQVNNFEALLIRTTFGLALADTGSISAPALNPVINETSRRNRYATVNYSLDTLEEAWQIEGPKFVFAHIVSPHAPYIFGPDGEFLADQNDLIPGYGNQVSYLNQRILAIVSALLANSDTAPIIILQGDHGGPETQPLPIRMNIFNAYYLPENGSDLLYKTISPVNTFRVIFDRYFGTNLGLLEDTSYYSTSEDFFDFTVTLNPCESN